MTEEINKGCEFQSDCIEYKDISYLKIMPICAIYELSIACHHKVNRCKYYKLYEQLKRLEQENKKLKKDVQLFKCLDTFGESECRCACRCLGNEFCEDADKKIEKYRSALEEIRVIADDTFKVCDDDCGNARKIKLIIDKINEVLTP